ncbi:MAG: hypothetical protein WCQ16_02875 [Verrucomicrobiae bacterium]
MDLDILTPAEPIKNAVRERWGWLARYLQGLNPSDPVLLIDSRDVVFLRDPRPDLESVLAGCDIVFFSEGQGGAGHQWCRNQYERMEQLTGNPFVADVEINGGCICGRAGALAKMAGQLACMMRVASRRKSTISDQPMINLWARKFCSFKTQIILPDARNIYCHGELVRHGRWPLEPMGSAIFHQWERTGFKTQILELFQ